MFNNLKMKKPFLLVSVFYLLCAAQAQAQNNEVLSSNIVSIGNASNGYYLKDLDDVWDGVEGGLAIVTRDPSSNDEAHAFNWSIDYLDNGAIRFRNDHTKRCIVNAVVEYCDEKTSSPQEQFEFSLTGSGSVIIKKWVGEGCLVLRNFVFNIEGGEVLQSRVRLSNDCAINEGKNEGKIPSNETWFFAPKLGAPNNLLFNIDIPPTPPSPEVPSAPPHIEF